MAHRGKETTDTQPIYTPVQAGQLVGPGKFELVDFVRDIHEKSSTA